jgi:hypothetical protein
VNCSSSMVSEEISKFDADGATAPETLRQKDHTISALWREAF